MSLGEALRSRLAENRFAGQGVKDFSGPLLPLFALHALTAVAQSNPASPAAPLSLWYRQPAQKWEEALPVGNGRLGATVFGRIYKETVIFNEDSVWTRWPDDRNNPDALAALPEARRLVFDGQKAPNPYEFAKDTGEASRLVVVQGVSKMYAMTGFRLGWAVANRELVRVMTNIQSQETSGPSTPSQWAAVGALNGVQSSIENLRMTLENNRGVMLKRVKAIPGVHVTKPGGTFYCFPDFSAYMKDSQKLAEFLLERVRVVTVPGKEFGMEGHLRLSYCGTIKEIMDGLERIKWAIDPSAPNELFLGDRKLVRDWA